MKKRRQRSSSNIWKPAALFVGGLIVALMLSEAVLHIGYGDKYASRPAFYGPDDRLGWEPSPGLDHTFHGPDYSIKVRTDENGYRLGLLGEVNFDKKLVILCGDSYTFGWGVSTNETFASFLDQKVHDFTHGRARVVNLGVGGYGTWQHAYRLSEFTQKYRESNVAAIIVMHCQNDVIDNVKALGYQLGLWKAGERPGKKSKLHLVNFLRHSLDRSKTRNQEEVVVANDDATRDPFMQDILWSAENEGDFTFPKHFVVAGDSVFLDSMSPLDFDETLLVMSKTLTPIQRELSRVGNKLINDQAFAMGCRVFHTYVYTTSDWYIKQVDQEITKSATEMVFGAGRVPAAGEFKGRFLNDHSGKHYNVEFNRAWSDQILQMLINTKVIEAW